jgi:hypothetical protein
LAEVQNTASASPAYRETQIPPALRLAGSPSQAGHQHSATITFKVTDAGDPGPGRAGIPEGGCRPTPARARPAAPPVRRRA